MTGAGVKEFFEAVDASRAEYERHVLCPTLSATIADSPPFASLPLPIAHGPRTNREYLPELQRAREAREKKLGAMKEESLSRFMKDLAVDRERHPAAAQADRWDPAQDGNEDEDDDDLDVNIVDRSTCRFAFRTMPSTCHLSTAPSPSLLPLLSHPFCSCSFFSLFFFVHLLRRELTPVPAPSGEDAWPGQYIDVTRMRPRNDEGMAWPRPG